MFAANVWKLISITCKFKQKTNLIASGSLESVRPNTLTLFQPPWCCQLDWISWRNAWRSQVQRVHPNTVLQDAKSTSPKKASPRVAARRVRFVVPKASFEIDRLLTGGFFWRRGGSCWNLRVFFGVVDTVHIRHEIIFYSFLGEEILNKWLKIRRSDETWITKRFFQQVGGKTEVKWSVTKFSTFDASSSLLTRCSTYTRGFQLLWLENPAPLYKHCMLEIRMANKKVSSNHQRDLWYPLVFMFSFICDLDNIHHLPTYISQ